MNQEYLKEMIKYLQSFDGYLTLKDMEDTKFSYMMSQTEVYEPAINHLTYLIENDCIRLDTRNATSLKDIGLQLTPDNFYARTTSIRFKLNGNEKFILAVM